MDENKVNNNSSLDITFNDKKKDKKYDKGKDSSFDLLSSDGDSYLRSASNTVESSETEKEHIDFSTDEFDLSLNNP